MNSTPTTVGDIVGGGSATNNVEANGNKVIKSDPVAQIGETKYETIADAVAAAQAGVVIEIIKAGDYTLPNLSKNVTIEGKADGVVSFTHATAGSVASIPNGATFKNVTFNFGNVNYHGFQHAGTINMEGCTLNGLLFSYSDMNFTNCTFGQSNKDYHMWCYAGNVTYTGCTFTNEKTGKFLNVYNESGATKYTVTANNCKFVNNASAANKAAINVKATSGSNLLAYDVIINNCTTEGAFPEASESQALVVLKDLVQVDDRTADGVDNIKVYENDVLIYPVNYVAKIGDVKYETLEDAFAAAKDGETITLLKDCAGNGIKAPQGTFSQGLTVDFAGHTYTVDGTTVGSAGTETNGFQLLKDNKITFKNGTITSEKAKILIQNYSDLTLEGMTLTLNNANYASAYTLSNNNGNIVIDGSTINANTGGGFAFDVCRYASYPSVGVTVKGESKINGDVEVFASNNDAKDGFKLMLEAGTMTGNIVLDASAKAAMAAAPEKALVMKSETFTKDAPADYKWVAAEEGKQKLVACDYVAQINEKKYETLEAAFAAAQDGATITLLKDCAGNGIKAPQGTFSQGLTVDFAGHTYTVDGTTVGSAGTETNGFQLLKDNKITFKGGTITSEKAKILIQNYSDLTLDGMTLTLNNANYASAYTLSNNNGNIVIDGSTINANTGGGFAFDVCRYASYPSVGVTVKGDSKINGDVEVSASNNDAKDGFSLMLEGGTMTGNIVLDASAKAAMAAAPEKATVSKSNTLTAIAAPDGYKWVDNGDGTSTLAPAHYVAQIGDVKYESLTEAVAAAGTAETTITLIADAATEGVICGEGVVVPSGSNIIFDLNGLTYEVNGKTVGSTGTETQGFQLLKNSNITIKNGTLKATSPTAQMVIQNYSNLTLEDVNLDGTGLSGWAYALSNNCGTINLNGSTSITAKAGGSAFDTCKFGSYAIPTVNVNTTGTISGPIEATGGKLNIENGKFDVTWVTDSHYAAGDIQIKGGVFSAEPAEEYIAEGCVVIENTDEATKADYPYAVKTKEDAGIFELVHGEPYPYPEGRKASKVTYRRSFETEEVNHYRCWYVPFDYTIQAEDMNNFDFYKIHMIAGSGDTGGEVADNTKVYIYIEKVKDAGTVLRGNRPYVIRPKSAMTEHIFTADNITEIYPENNESRLHQETTEFEYDYYGTYREHQATGRHEFISLNKKGQTQWNASENAKLQSYVWYIKVTSRGDIDYAKTNIFFVDIDDDTTDIFRHQVDSNDVEGVYTVSGAKVEKPVKGVNIIRYKNGTTKKIYVK